MDFENNLQKFIINNKFLNDYSINKNTLNFQNRKLDSNSNYQNNLNNFNNNLNNFNNNFVKKQHNNEDSIFWCFYKIINGEFNYMLNKGFKEQVNTKINFVEELRKKKTQLKQNKIKLMSLETDVINNKDININTLNALCIIYNKNIIYVNNNCFFNMIQNEDDNIYLISNKENNYEFKENISLEKVNYYKNNFYEILNFYKPIKSINNYSKEDLIIFSKKLNIENCNKINKQDLYEKIKIECMKFK